MMYEINYDLVTLADISRDRKYGKASMKNYVCFKFGLGLHPPTVGTLKKSVGCVLYRSTSFPLGIKLERVPHFFSVYVIPLAKHISFTTKEKQNRLLNQVDVKLKPV